MDLFIKPRLQAEKDLDFLLYNLEGRLIHLVAPEKVGDGWKIDVSFLPAGVYFLLVSGHDYTMTHRLVKI